MIAKDGMPISSGDKERTRFFLEEIGLLPQMTFSSKTVRKYLLALGEFSLQKQTKLLGEVQAFSNLVVVSLSVDIWTSHTGQQIGVQCTFVNPRDIRHYSLVNLPWNSPLER